MPRQQNKQVLQWKRDYPTEENHKESNMAKQYTFTEVTAEMRAQLPQNIIEMIEANNRKAIFQNMSEEEKQAYIEKKIEERKLITEEKRYERATSSRACLLFDEEKTVDSIHKLAIQRFFDEKYGFVCVFTNATAVTNKVQYAVMGKTNKDNASLIVKDMLKGTSNKFTRAGAARLTKNGTIENEDGTTEKYTGSNQRMMDFLKGMNNKDLQALLDGYKTSKGDDSYPVINTAELEEKSTKMKTFKAAVRACKG